MHPRLSVVVPVFNEEDVLPLLVERLRPVLDELEAPYEVVAVDDGSTDASAVVLQRIRHEWPQLRVVRLRANAGHQAAISAGLARAHGDYIVTIDADLQDPPEVVADMYRLAVDEQVDVVYGVRTDRSTDTAFKRGTARAFYATMRAVSPTSAPADAGDFRLMSRATVDAVNALPEHHRVLRLVVPALGFPSATVTYRREERAAGTSKYPLSKMIKLSIDSLTSHSMAPLRLATWCGLLGGAFALLILAYALLSLFTGRAVAGWTSTVAAVSSVGAVQLICLGVLGEYVGRMYTMMQGRPTYFVAHDTDDVRRNHDPHADDPVGLTSDAAPAADATSALTDGAVEVIDEPDTSVASEATTVMTTIDPDDVTGAEVDHESAPLAPVTAVAADSRGTGSTAVTYARHAGTRNAARRRGERPTDGGDDVMDADLRQAVRRTSASSVTPGNDLTGR